MNKTKKLEELVSEHNFESLHLPKLKAEKSNFDLQSWIDKLLSFLDIESNYEVSSWVKPLLMWGLVFLCTAFVIIQLLRVWKKTKKKKNRAVINKKNTLFTSKSQVFLDEIKLSLKNRDFKRAMKLRWLYKLQQRDMLAGYTLSEIFSSKHKVEDLNFKMFSPEAEVSKDDYMKLKDIKFRGKSER